MARMERCSHACRCAVLIRGGKLCMGQVIHLAADARLLAEMQRWLMLLLRLAALTSSLLHHLHAEGLSQRCQMLPAHHLCAVQLCGGWCLQSRCDSTRATRRTCWTCPGPAAPNSCCRPPWTAACGCGTCHGTTACAPSGMLLLLLQAVHGIRAAQVFSAVPSHCLPLAAWNSTWHEHRAHANCHAQAYRLRDCPRLSPCG